MTLPSWHEEPISKHHPRDRFDCGDGDLNVYLQRYARQNHEGGGAKTFLAIDDVDSRVLGFYTLAPCSIAHEHAPSDLMRGQARHDVPGYRLARLAIDRTLQGQGLGGQLLLSAGERCLRVATEVGGLALAIDAKNERAARWYAGYGAVRLTGMPDPDVPPFPMVIALKTIAAALEVAGSRDPQP
jgi:GNAT superfamily N-acetyltransferase